MATLVVEDGTGLADANSFSSVAEVTQYHSDYGNAGWANPAAAGRVHLPAQPTAGDTVTVGSVTYTFVASPAASKDVRIGASAAETQANLAAAVNGTGNRGYAYHAGTAANPDVSCSDFSGGVAVLTASLGGAAGNLLALSMTTSAPASNYVEAFSGGEDAMEGACIRGTRYLQLKYGQRWNGTRLTQEQALDWPRADVFDRDGYEVPSSPLPADLKRAHAEASLLCLGGDPLPDVTADSSVGAVSESVSVGPISVSETYGGAKATETRYRKIDALLANLASGGSQGVRG